MALTRSLVYKFEAYIKTNRNSLNETLHNVSAMMCYDDDDDAGILANIDFSQILILSCILTDVEI